MGDQPRPKVSRRRAAQFNVRQQPDVREKFLEAMKRLSGVVQKAGGEVR